MDGLVENVVGRDEDMVHEGDTVIVKMHDELDTMIKIFSSTEQKIGKGRVDVTPIIGCTYGTIFEIKGRKLVKVDGMSAVPPVDGKITNWRFC
jgi:UTP-glucose-1-phosphate uridylyltransferase